MLDDKQPMQAKADRMRTRESNTKVHYDGHAVMWQGANRIAADVIDIDRDAQSLRASGNVVSELVDNTANGDGAGTAAPVFTIVRAPELNYRDDLRLAVYTGGVTLTREKMTVAAKEIKAYLNPKDDTNKGQSSLNKAFADSGVQIAEATSDGTRTGTSEHCEYYTKDEKVVLNGGAPKMVDSRKGVTKGRELIYYSGDDHLIVEGENKQLAYTQMKKR